LREGFFDPILIDWSVGHFFKIHFKGHHKMIKIQNPLFCFMISGTTLTSQITFNRCRLLLVRVMIKRGRTCRGPWLAGTGSRERIHIFW
jgi:hypothetical protein